MISTYGLKDSENSYSINISCELWSIKANLYVTLSCKVVYLGWLHFAYELHK